MKGSNLVKDANNVVVKIGDVNNMANINTGVTLNFVKEKSSGCSHYKRRALFVVCISFRFSFHHLSKSIELNLIMLLSTFTFFHSSLQSNQNSFATSQAS